MGFIIMSKFFTMSYSGYVYYSKIILLYLYANNSLSIEAISLNCI